MLGAPIVLPACLGYEFYSVRKASSSFLLLLWSLSIVNYPRRTVDPSACDIIDRVYSPGNLAATDCSSGRPTFRHALSHHRAPTSSIRKLPLRQFGFTGAHMVLTQKLFMIAFNLYDGEVLSRGKMSRRPRDA